MLFLISSLQATYNYTPMLKQMKALPPTAFGIRQHSHGVFSDGSLECKRNWLSLLSQVETEKFSEFLGKLSKGGREGHPHHLLPRTRKQTHPGATINHTSCGSRTAFCKIRGYKAQVMFFSFSLGVSTTSFSCHISVCHCPSHRGNRSTATVCPNVEWKFGWVPNRCICSCGPDTHNLLNKWIKSLEYFMIVLCVWQNSENNSLGTHKRRSKKNPLILKAKTVESAEHFFGICALRPKVTGDWLSRYRGAK